MHSFFLSLRVPRPIHASLCKMLPINLGLPALLVILLVCIVYRFIVWNFALIVLCRIYTCVEHTKKMSFFLNLQFLFLPSRLFRVLSNPLIISLQWLVRMICLYPPIEMPFLLIFLSTGLGFTFCDSSFLFA